MKCGRFYWLMVLLPLGACKKSLDGNLNANQPPETFSVVDTIIRFGDHRLNSQVEMHWWGNDADGIVVGYEFTFDASLSTWYFTTKQDTTFLLATPPGEDTADFRIYVRAIDNEGARDPTPAALTLPIKNSPPAVSFLAGTNNPLKTFPVLRFYWQGSDPDGEENLNHYELCWNDTNQQPYSLEVTVTSAIFEATDLTANVSDCNVFANNSTTAETDLMHGLILNDTDVLYIRAVDDALQGSAWVASYKIFVKKPVSDILLIDGYISNGGSVETFYTQHLASIGFPVVDTMQIFETQSSAYTQLSPDNLSQAKVFDLFKTIVWFTNDAATSLSLGQRTLNDFFNDGGKLLMSVYVSSLFDQQSNFLDFTPIQNFITPTDTTLLLTDTSDVFALQTGYPDLQSTAFVGVVRPFNTVVGATPLYNAELIAKDNLTFALSPWNGVSTTMAKKTNTSGETNFIISTLELQLLDGLGNVDALFDQIFNIEFGW